MLTREGCLDRQRRLREILSAQSIEAAILTDYREIYYFSGVLLPERFPAFLFLETDGGSWLVAHSNEDGACVDDRLAYEWHQLYTTNPDLLHQLNAAVAKRLSGCKLIKRLGWQSESVSRLIAESVDRVLRPQQWISMDDILFRMHKRKDADEIALIRRSIQADLAAYTAVQRVIAPGVTELEVLAAGQRAAMLTAGEKVFHDGDYRSGQPGGPARHRRIERGEIYIVDAWTIYRGYWSDLCRAFIVGGQPTDLQQSIFDHMAAVQRKVADLLKPGLKGTTLFRALDESIREHPALSSSGLIHHAGHGVGLRPHEAPDLNRDREGILEVGDVVSVEPGGYTEAARCGVRIENTYLISESGAENLSDYPIKLNP